MVISNLERSLGVMGKYSGLDGLTIYAHATTDPVLLLYGYGEDFQGVSWKIQGGTAALAIASPRAALLIPVPQPPGSLYQGKPSWDEETYAAHLKLILDSIAPFFDEYQPEYWPVPDLVFHVIVCSRCKCLLRDVYWPVLKPLLQKYSLPANDVLMLRDFRMPDVPDDQDITFVVHDKQGHSHVTLLGGPDRQPPWFYIGVEDLDDRAVRVGQLPGRSSDRSSVFRILSDRPPPKLSTAGSLASKVTDNDKAREVHVQPLESAPSAFGTSASEGKGKAKEVHVPPESGPSASRISPAKGKGKRKAKEVHWESPERTPAVSRETSAPEGKDKYTEAEREKALSDWWESTGYAVPEGGRTEFQWPAPISKSAQSRSGKAAASKDKGKGVQREPSLAGPQVSNPKDKDMGKGKQAERAPPSEPTPFVSQALTPQDSAQRLPPLATIGLPTPNVNSQGFPCPPTFGDSGQDLPRLATLLPPVWTHQGGETLPHLAALGLPTAEDRPITLPPLVTLGLPTPNDNGRGGQRESSSLASQTSTSENRDKGGQRQSSFSATSQTPISRVRDKEDPYAPN
ncbi:hypothetical protein BJX68DRAFT_272308 [Aspergillus pseudodeflectus]|uniref:Uncharacterized protein n=1 Tax=Aspergillus pseudodeflectus TaxID=176178 RepID=A0ABR4JGB4_9EURO